MSKLQVTEFPIFLPLLLTLFLAYWIIDCKSANVGQWILRIIPSRYQMKNAWTLIFQLVKPIHFAYKKAISLIIYLLLFKVNVNDYKVSQNITGCITLSSLNCVERMWQ